jgi:hypothetical protein
MGIIVKRVDSWRLEESIPVKVVSPRSAEAWKEIPHLEHDAIWDRFYDAFAFRPSVSASDWPSFREPTPSVTWDLEQAFDAIGECIWHAAGTAEYNAALLRALQQHVAPDERVLALDWQHSGSFFYPHRWSFDDPPAAWEIPSLPDGEYHIFVAEDFRFGSLGHPWEQTLCIFGAGFLETYLSSAPRLLNRVVRRNGRAV